MKIAAIPFYLTKSKIRADLLTLFFLNPETDYYLRELERRLGCSAGILARELKTFSESGLLQREARGMEIFYRINPQYSLYSELKGIVEKTAGIPKRLSEGLKKIKEIKEAYLYGSFVKGKIGADSDIDLLLVGKETTGLTKLLKNLETKFGRGISAVSYSPDEFETKRKDKSEFLFEVMKSPLIQLKS